MKKTILFSSALVALAMLASCQKEEFVETPTIATGVTEFTATIESTKTTIASDGKVNWEQDDEITVTDVENNSAVYVAASSGATTTFTLKQGQTAVGAGPYRATYGDINNQKYSANGANCPLTAQSSTTNFTFSSPYAVLKITAKSSNSDVIKTVVVTYGDNGSFLDCGDGVTLTNEGVDFYVAIEPANAKLSVAFYNTADKMAKKTRTESISLAAKNLLPVTFDLSDWGTPIFKAVLDASNKLTFYYDTKDYSGDGITIYQNGTSNYLLDQSKSMNQIWGYYDKSTNITGVVIDPSVAVYKGLTSTTFMFYGMTIADSISGAQYLDVSNVTDMSSMFNRYGYNSASLTAVPDVSEWDTGNVENMNNLFDSYGHDSNILTDVPDVSKWNTGRVTNMNSIFSSYGRKSNSLTAVPDVSGWKTDNVTKMGTLFAFYGDTNKDNINCVLDLTGWNLANLTAGNNVFYNFSPNTFKVTIPAKTGENANLPKKWYGSGTSSFAPPEDHYFMFTGVFTVSDPDGTPNSGDEMKVYFSKGNLWYGKDGGATDATWNFETNQYDISSSWNESHVSNFYWSQTTSSAYATTYDNNGSTGDVLFTNETETTPNAGFTVNGNAGVWRTLSQIEWQYLLANHTYKYVSVNGKFGIVIAPDGFSGTIADSYSATTWATAEAAGLVFLPSTGYRTGGSILEVSGDPISCIYWTSTAVSDNAENAYRMFFQWDGSTLSTNFNDGNSRKWAVGIRLVTNVPAE